MAAYFRKDSNKWFIKFDLNRKTYKRDVPEAACKEDAEEAEREWRHGLALYTTWETKGTCRTNRGSVGGVAELLVCADLLRKGYDVFRSVTNSAACDVVVMRDGLLCRVEVKAGRSLKSGRGTFIIRPSQIGKHDVVAVALLDTSRIIYQPTIEEWFAARLVA